MYTSLQDLRNSILEIANRDLRAYKLHIDPARRISKGESTPMIMASDWHFGEVVESAAIGGYNEFNVRIAEKSIKIWLESVVRLLQNYTVNPKFPQIYLQLLGDFISGENHDLPLTNELSSLQAVNKLIDIFIAIIEELLNRFNSHFFIPMTLGNHGRMTIDLVVKNYAAYNFEWLLYQRIMAHFKDNKRVTFLFSESNQITLDVYGNKILQVHGDKMGVGGGDGQVGALGPITRGAMKLRNSELRKHNPIQVVAMGHWHTRLHCPNQGFIVNGSLKGYDEWADFNKLTPEEPTQHIYFMHPERRFINDWPVYCR